MRLRGRVASGIGDLTKWMLPNREVYAAATGEDLYPGSLNVVLDVPWFVPAGAQRLEPSDFRVGGVGMSIVPCAINGLPAFILRSDRNNAGIGNHPPTVIEVAASVRLRDALALADGDEVVVDV